MKKKVVLILVILLFGCSSTQEVDQSIDLIVPSGNSNNDAGEAAGLPSAIVKGNDDIIEGVRPTWTPLPTLEHEGDLQEESTTDLTETVEMEPCSLPAGWTTYKVAVGDTLSEIALRAGATLDELVRINCLTEPRNIEPNQILYVPKTILPPATLPPTSTPEPTVTATATPAPAEGITIDFLKVTPADDVPINGSITVDWQVTGGGTFQLIWQVNQLYQGIVIDEGRQGEHRTVIDFDNVRQTPLLTLIVTDENNNSTQEMIEISTTCPYSYFVSEPAIQGDKSCPWGDRVISAGIWQAFERGFMVRHQDHSGQYVIASLNNDGDLIGVNIDLWDEEPNAWDETPPDGLQKPEEGLGKVWAESLEIRRELGWAVDAPLPYQATSQQMDNASSKGWVMAGHTYVTLPDGKVIRYTTNNENDPSPMQWFWVD